MDRFLYILPAAIALFWVLRIFFLKNLNKVQLFIVAGMLMAVLTMFYREGFVLFVFPMFHMAVRQNTAPQGITKWDWLALLPSFLFVPYTDTIYFTVFMVIQIVTITVWSIISVRKYNSRLAEVYDTGSEASSDDISQVLTFIIITIVVLLIWMLLPEDATSSFLIAAVFAAFLSALQFMIGYYTYYMKDTSSIAAELAEIEEVASETEDSSPDEVKEDDALIRKVLADELYLDPMASLVSIAEKLGTNRTYLSNSIHSCRGQNFSDFINTLRISRFIDIVTEEGRDVNIKDAAMRCGYSNLQSFYRNFSELKKMTPKAWISENVREDS